MLRQTYFGPGHGRVFERARWGVVFPAFAYVSAGWGMGINPPAPNPAKPVNYVAWINETFEKGLKDNAFDDYQKAFDRLRRFKGRWQQVIDDPGAENPRLAAWLRSNREALDLFRQAAAKEDCFYHHTPAEAVGDSRIDEFLFGVSLSWLPKCRDAMIGLVAQGDQAAKAGDCETLADNSLVVLKSAHHYYDGPMLITRMMATRGASWAYSGIRRALRECDDPGALAAGIVKELSTIDPPLPPLRMNARLERVASWDFCQRLFVPGEQHLYEPLCQMIDKMRGKALTPVERMRINQAGFEDTLREVNAYFDLLENRVDRPYHLTAGGRGEREGLESIDYIRAETRNPVVKLILPSFSSVRDQNAQLTATRRATHLIVRLHDYRRRHGEFPKRLDQLEAADLAELRVDPFSGRDFVYQRKWRGFKLYTVSQNMKDDGGRHEKKKPDQGDYVFWPVPD